MKKQRAALWDFDGTLVDTAELHFEAWVRTCNELGRPFTRADFAATFGRRNPEILKYLFGPESTNSANAEIGARKEEYYIEAVQQTGVELLPGVKSLLEGLRAAGFLQAIGSSAPRRNLEVILNQIKAAGYFQALTAMEDVSRGKPDPEVFLVAAKKLGVPPENCVVFEDAIAGVQAAKSAGMKCVAVTFVGHHVEEKLLEAGADRCVKILEELNAEDIINLLK